MLPSGSARRMRGLLEYQTRASENSPFYEQNLDVTPWTKANFAEQIRTARAKVASGLQKSPRHFFELSQSRRSHAHRFECHSIGLCCTRRLVVMHKAGFSSSVQENRNLCPAFDAVGLFRERSWRSNFHLRWAVLWLCHFGDGLGGHRIATVATENDHSGPSTGLRKGAEVSHRFAATVADSSLALIRAHEETSHNAAAIAARKPLINVNRMSRWRACGGPASKPL